MKTVLNILLAAAAIVLTVMCYQSLMIPIEFNEKVAQRDEVVIQRLKDIRTLQEEYQHKYQVYCDSWDALVNFAKNDSIAIVNKVGSLTDEQLALLSADKFTERDAWRFLCDPKKYKNEISKYSLSKEKFSRDSIYVSVLEKDSALRRPDFNIDQLRYIPFAADPQDTIILATGSVTSASGFVMPLFEAKIPFEKYLFDLDAQELNNKITDRVEMDRFPGMMVGDATQANNNAGNWE